MSELAPKKKILFVITKGTWGGAQKYVFDLATSIDKEKFEPVVAFGTFGVLKEKLEAAAVRTIQLESIGRDINPLLDLASLFELIKIFKAEKPDVVHLNSSKIGGLGALAGRIAKVPKIIFTAHGWAFNEQRNILARAVIYLLSWLTVACSHTVIVLSDKEKNQAERMWFSKNKIEKIFNGLPEIEFIERNKARAFIAQKAKLPTNAPRIPWIVTIAELHKNKGLEYAIDAIPRLTAPVYYFIIGSGEEKKSLENQIWSNHLEERVFLLGTILNAASLLRAFDIFLLSSLKEGLPYVLLEAGYAGLPVITTPVGGIREIVEENTSGIIINPADSLSISSQLTALLQDPEKAKALGIALEQETKKKFNSQVMVQETTHLYEALV
jgi:glycosyltransferase involved in cell wall biosynthesis